MPQASRGRRASTPPSARSSSSAGTIARQRPPGARANALTSKMGTSGRPRAVSGGRTPSSAEVVCATSQIERRSRLTAPGTAPSPQTMNGTGDSPQS
jgi:hypothetical protein